MWEPGRAVLSPLGAPQSRGCSGHFSCLCGLFRKLKSAKSRLASGSAHCSEVDALSESTEGMLLFPQRGASSSEPSSVVWNGERKEQLAPARDPSRAPQSDSLSCGHRSPPVWLWLDWLLHYLFTTALTCTLQGLQMVR